MYSAVKHAHMLFALISGLLFLLRGVWMILDSEQLQRRWVKIVPHVVDTCLLVCAVILMVILSQYPFVHHWLTAKVIALVLYIVAGTFAIKRGKTKGVRVFALIVALALYGYMVGVAINHNALSFLAP